MKRSALFLLVTMIASYASAEPLVYEGTDGPGRGKHLVFLAGDQEYRSEQTLPALARLLAKHYGFKCTVAFTLDPTTGEIDPGSNHLPDVVALDDADLMVVFLRFRDLPDEQMKHIADYLDRGGPIVGLRTATHAFKIPAGKTYAKFDFVGKEPDYLGGFGRKVLGETWAGHYGTNHKMSTRLDLVDSQKSHPVLRGVSKVWVQSGGYWAEPLPDVVVLANAQPLDGMTIDSQSAADKKPCPGAWVRDYRSAAGKKGRVFTSLYGASEDILNDGYRRMLVNACLWAVGLETQITDDGPIDFVGPYKPTTFAGGKHLAGVKPSDLAGWEAPIMPPNAVPAAVSKPAAKKKDKVKKPKAKSGSPVLMTNPKDAKNVVLDVAPPATDEDFTPFGIYEQTAPRPAPIAPVATSLPLKLAPGLRIALIGNTLFERSQEFGHFEAMLQRRFAQNQLVVRHLAWSADAIDLQPRPDNFADTEQHLTHERADVVIAAFGFNESFAGEAGLPAFRKTLAEYLTALKSKAYNGKSAPQIVLVSPTANENIKEVAAADLNNARLKAYVDAMREVAAAQQVGFVDVYTPTFEALGISSSPLTFNGIHLTADGDRLVSESLFRQLTGEEAPPVDDALCAAIVDKNRQFFRRFRPLNTFYYTGGRSKTYGYLDFLPAMRNFDLMTANRDRRIWDLADGKAVSEKVDDSNVPPLPRAIENRGVNEWLSPADELKAFQVDPRFEVNLFAGEEQFPDVAAPIAMRWDARGRLWVSCSTTYPHVYPGNEPNDKLVILEDVDGDGRADKSTVFADDLHIPLSFEFGDGGVYVSEQPQITFRQDTDGDDRADVRRPLLTGFGTEDSHHSAHDFTWTPDGDLIFRESVFHHSQVETPYGPVRQQNSGWFRYTPHTQRLLSFGTYHSTNPWGVTFDDWGQHVASHPVYAAAFHSLDPPYPQQHPAPKGLQGYSGVCGHQFVDFATFPEELHGGFIKVRYKPTNRIEMFKWNEKPFGYEEEYVGDLLFSTNLSFIPVDLQFGPRGDLYVCDWYNPVKGHMQYSLRDDRRDRHSGRIWRITAKGRPTQEPPKLAEASVGELLDLLKRPEYLYRFWAKRELRERNADEVKRALDAWVAALKPDDPRFRHHQLEAVWTYRWIDAVNVEPLRELLACDEHHARAAATQQLRYWHSHLSDAGDLLRKSSNDESAIVRMEAVIAASYIGTKEAFDAALDVLKHPREGHLAYAVACSFGSHTLRPYWEGKPQYGIARLLKEANKELVISEPTPTASEAQFDRQSDLKTVRISCVPEKMLFTVTQFTATAGQPVKVVFTNPDATDHNLAFVEPGALAEVGMAANEMAKDPRNAAGDFLPPSKRSLILHASPMIGPTRSSQVYVFRFQAPQKPGIYPFVCTFPGHWVVMNGVMAVGSDAKDAEMLLAAAVPAVVKEWKMADFADFSNAVRPHDEATVMRGMQAFVKARCNQCHVVAGHGVNLGPDLAESVKKLKGDELLRNMLEPSYKIHEKFQNQQFIMSDGRAVTGVVVKEDADECQVVTNLLTPHSVTHLLKRDIDERTSLKTSPMPEGLMNILTRDEILDLHAFIESGGYQLPKHLNHSHGHSHGHGTND